MRRHLNKNRLIKIISKIKKVNVLVLGDIILDHYICGKAERLSPEAPVPVVWANRQNYLLGGASNVAYNLASLGTKVGISGVVGEDENGKLILELLKKEKIKRDFVLCYNQRPTTLKTRIIAQHQQVVRVDWESIEQVSPSINKKIIQSIRKNVSKFDSLIIEDYGKGLINPKLLEKIIDICKKNKKIITVDPKEEHFDYYDGITTLTPNLKEAQSATHMIVKRKADLNILGKKIMDKLSPRALLLTLGEDWMRLFLDQGSIWHLPTYALEVFDVSGAGDTVIAVYTAALSTGASFLEAAFLANIAAGIVVGKLGVASVSALELTKRVKDYFDKVHIQKIN